MLLQVEPLAQGLVLLTDVVQLLGCVIATSHRRLGLSVKNLGPDYLIRSHRAIERVSATALELFLKRSEISDTFHAHVLPTKLAWIGRGEASSRHGHGSCVLEG